ncbi:DUF6586 family protein [Microbulbifer litoralis]|uniref:DUF6586 family protein n=1 Tax=Microbulbifer litoralis TaxID=2933965 RepID=UPI0020280CDC|nr:DUF6586 family protein [Microbulbifer sp. GX H0434]
MSNPYTGAVASALRKGELLLSLEQAAPLQQAAVLEAAVLHLWRAYRAFLAELAYQLQLNSEPESAQALAERATALGKTCSEAVELSDLAADPDSWLSQLQAAWVQLWSFSAESRPHTAADNLIPLQNLSAPQPAALTETRLRQWHAGLAELIRRQRAQSEEW